MRVLVTGAGGNLGRVVVPALVEAGHRPRLFDFRPLDTEHEFVQGDVRDQGVVERALDNVDAVVHAAALQGLHLPAWSADDLWSINVDGTFTLYQAVQSAAVQHVVFASSMVVYGGVAGRGSSWTTVTEDSELRPADLYGVSKVVGEDIARFAADVSAITTVTLRFGMYVPETFERYGFRLLFGGVDDRDVAHAVVLALSHEPPDRFAAYNIMADHSLADADPPGLDADLEAALDERWPGTVDLVRERGLDLTELVWGRFVFPVTKARTVLGYSPRYDFKAFLSALRRDDHAHYPFAGEPWWGVQGPDM